MKTNFRRILTLKIKLFLLVLAMCVSVDNGLVASDRMSAKFLEDILNDTEIPMDRASPTPCENPFLEGLQFGLEGPNVQPAANLADFILWRNFLI